jgi:hypothetical protein
MDQWQNSATGTFLHGNGTVVLQGSNMTGLTKAETFYNLTLDKSGSSATHV